MTLNLEMDVGFRREALGDVGVEGQLGCPFLLQALSPVSTVTTILCIQVGMEAATLGNVHRGVPGPSE